MMEPAEIRRRPPNPTIFYLHGRGELRGRQCTVIERIGAKLRVRLVDGGEIVDVPRKRVRKVAPNRAVARPVNGGLPGLGRR